MNWCCVCDLEFCNEGGYSQEMGIKVSVLKMELGEKGGEGSNL
jgi:hypothetical protein